MNRRALLIAEFLLFFVLVPGGLLLWQLQTRVPFFPVLFGLLGLTLFLGWRDKDLRFRFDGSWEKARRFLPQLLLRVAVAALILFALTWFVWNDLFLRLPRQRPHLWMLVMMLYPLLSVVPQEYLFRIFFMQRYRPLFGEGALMLWVNALVFGWAHIFFLNPIAPLLSVIAGLLLADTWRRTRSLRAVWLEHALYGQIVFTCGLGWFFFHGSVRALSAATGL
jgi:hypothetical protein